MLNMSITGRLYFNSRPSARGDRSRRTWDKTISRFQFTPLREGRLGVMLATIYNFISIHAPPRGATDGGVARRNRRVFQFTPLREGRRTSRRRSRRSHQRFQFTPLREGRRPSVCWSATASDFNSRPSARGDRACRFLVFCGFSFQFTPLREGRLDARFQCLCGRHFNSRPSARGDPGWLLWFGFIVGFQFTPLREGRRRSANRHRGASNFNSRPSARGDSSVSAPADAASIFQFTPLREGRQHVPDQPAEPVPHFNSRPSARGDATCFIAFMCWANFNSRPSARGDGLQGGLPLPLRHDFNSRPSARGDGAWLPPTPLRAYFNSRPSARGDKADAGEFHAGRNISIHAPPRGATQGLRRQHARHGNFNSRPSARGDSRTRCASCKRISFQFTPLREGRHRYVMVSQWVENISIHAPPRGATRRNER